MKSFLRLMAVAMGLLGCGDDEEFKHGAVCDFPSASYCKDDTTVANCEYPDAPLLPATWRVVECNEPESCACTKPGECRCK